MSRWASYLLAGLHLLLFGASTACAALLTPGDIVALVSGGIHDDRMVRIDPQTGATSALLSGFHFGEESDLAVAKDGAIFFNGEHVATGNRALFRFNPDTGDLHELSSALWRGYFGLAPSGDLVFAVDEEPRILRVDSDTGSTSLMLSGYVVGEDDDLVVGANGDVFFVGEKEIPPPEEYGVFRFNPATGSVVRMGPGVADEGGKLALAPNGDVILQDLERSSIFRIDRQTGSTSTILSGFEFEDEDSLAANMHGGVFFTGRQDRPGPDIEGLFRYNLHTGDLALLTSEVEEGELAIFEPDLQSFALAWGSDVPVEIRREVDEFGNVHIIIDEDGTMPAASISQALRDEITERVRQMFADSGVTNVVVTDTPGEDATTVYFTDPLEGLLGIAYTGIDQFNERAGDEVAVFFQGDGEIDAETVAHEVGHSLGLRHVNPNSLLDPSDLSIMDYDRNAGDSERFINGVSEITEPPDDPSGGTGVTHNPVYHLRRYVDWVAHDDLIA